MLFKKIPAVSVCYSDGYSLVTVGYLGNVDYKCVGEVFVEERAYSVVLSPVLAS